VADYLNSSVTNRLKRMGNILITVFFTGRAGNQPLISGRPREKWRQFCFGHGHDGSGYRQGKR